MTPRGDSYGTVAEVLAYTRHYLSGQSTYNSTTRPTLTEVEKFIDRASGALNVALNDAGLTTHITNSTAKLLCDNWTVAQAVGYVELAQRGSGFSGSENTRASTFLNLDEEARTFAKKNRLGFLRLGVVASHALSEGLAFTGLDAQEDRDDPDDVDLEQPKFSRGLFDND